MVNFFGLTMNWSEAAGMNAGTAAAPEEGSDPDSPDLPSGLLHFIHAGIYLEA